MDNNSGMLFKLFKYVTKSLDDGLSISEAFSGFAAQNGYTFKSVKKCFYATLAGLKSRPKLASRLGADLKQLTDSANIFNIAAVKKTAEETGDLNKALFVLCMGDNKEIASLRKRFDVFYPDFCLKPLGKTVNPAKKALTDNAYSLALALQSQYCTK